MFISFADGPMKGCLADLDDLPPSNLSSRVELWGGHLAIAIRSDTDGRIQRLQDRELFMPHGVFNLDSGAARAEAMIMWQTYAFSHNVGTVAFYEHEGAGAFCHASAPDAEPAQARAGDGASDSSGQSRNS